MTLRALKLREQRVPSLEMKEYIGDSVYAEFDGTNLILTTENGYPDDPRNRIVLEPEVWSLLTTWMDRAMARPSDGPSDGDDEVSYALRCPLEQMHD